MPDITLQIEVETREQLALVRDRVQTGLGVTGTIQLGAEPEALPDHHRGPALLVTAVIVCDEPVSDAIAVVRKVLPEFEVVEVGTATGEDARLTISRG